MEHESNPTANRVASEGEAGAGIVLSGGAVGAVRPHEELPATEALAAQPAGRGQHPEGSLYLHQRCIECGHRLSGWATACPQCDVCFYTEAEPVSYPDLCACSRCAAVKSDTGALLDSLMRGLTRCTGAKYASSNVGHGGWLLRPLTSDGTQYWLMVDNGGEIMLERLNTGHAVAVPYTRDGLLLDAPTMLYRVTQALRGEAIDYTVDWSAHAVAFSECGV